MSDREMLRTFNCGIGMTLCAPPAELERALAALRQSGETAAVIGEITADTPGRVALAA